jgi:hypothetical protein
MRGSKATTCHAIFTVVDQCFRGKGGDGRGRENLVIHARRFAAFSASALLPVAAMFCAALSANGAQAQGARACDDDAEISVLSSPTAPWRGAPLRVIVAAEKESNGELALIAPDGSVAMRSRDRRGGPPYFWIAEVKTPVAGTWRASLTRDRAPAGCATVTREIAVRADQPPRPSGVSGSVWPVRSNWTRGSENLFSAWIEKLFDDPLDAAPSWPALHVVMRDPARNMLFNHLGLGEDEMKMVLRPDCADLPYFLRAYFAFKMGLPFGFSKCTRGGAGKAPVCPAWFSIQNADSASRPAAAPQASAAQAAAPEPPASRGILDVFRQEEPKPAPQPAAAPPVSRPDPQRLGLAGSFGAFTRTLADSVHSGTGRTALNDNNTDYYPVNLSQETLRPGTIYADPYGHILMLVKRVPQTEGGAGVFLAVDGQPDGTVARKRFWRGNFLFAQDPALGGPGFKRFRPVVRGPDGALRKLSNDQIAKNPHYADYSVEQGQVSVEQFYDRMDDVMSPSPLDPVQAITEAITSLEEQVKTRVTSVENGRKFQGSGKGEASMPDGPAIFETTGAWEDFSTPSRDLRLLIAIDVVRNFPDRVARRPERYAMPRGKSPQDVKVELQRLLASELASRKFSYPRSDGSQWTLALKDVIERAPELEMAYNPNDCVELRWGAVARSEEAATCKRSAPQAQRAKMTKYRAWFSERRRPPRA